MKPSESHLKQAEACDALALDYPERSDLRVAYQMVAYRHRRVAVEMTGLERQRDALNALLEKDVAASGGDERDYFTRRRSHLD